MPVLKNADWGIRVIISVLFRLLIIVYSFSIVIRQSNYFEWYTYAAGTVIYIFIYLLLITKEGFLGWLRLFNDYMFFFLILFRKDINEFHTVTLLILPIVNSTNHSSRNRRPYYAIHLYVMSLLMLFFLRGFKFSWGDFVALIAFSLISVFHFTRSWMVNFHNSLYDVIDTFYEETVRIGKPHELLIKIIEKLKSESVFTKYIFDPAGIICFRVQDEGFRIVASTGNVSQFSIPNEEQLLKRLRSNGSDTRSNFTVNNRAVPHKMFFLVDTKESDFVFCIITNERPKIGIWNSLGLKMLKPLFKKVGRVILVEQELRSQRKVYLRKLKDKIEFIDSTIKAVHFLNNRLSPILNYFDIVKALDKMSPDDPKRSDLLQIMSKEQRTAMNNMEPIVDKTLRILKKSKNPYVITEVEEIKLSFLISMIRTTWDERGLQKTNFIVEWDENDIDLTVFTSLDGLEYVIDEILNNMEKYYYISYDVTFTSQEGSLMIVFRNRINPTVQKGELKRLVLDFNRDGVSELMKRNSHGMSLIKNFKQQINMEVTIAVDDDNFRCIISIPTQK